MFEVDLSPCQKISLGRLTSFFGGVLIGLPPDHCLGKSTLFSYHCQIKSWQLHHFILLPFTFYQNSLPFALCSMPTGFYLLIPYCLLLTPLHSLALDRGIP